MAIDAITGLIINWNDPRGYVRLSAKGHPLASGRDHVVPRHRLILWEALHPDASDPTSTFDPCRYCGHELPWKVEAGVRSFRRCINVDHLNGIPGDDRVENLATACFWCNANREWVVTDHGETAWLRIAELHADAHPDTRPYLPAVCEAFTGLLPSRFRAEVV